MLGAQAVAQVAGGDAYRCRRGEAAGRLVENGAVGEQQRELDRIADLLGGEQCGIDAGGGRRVGDDDAVGLQQAAGVARRQGFAGRGQRFADDAAGGFTVRRGVRCQRRRHLDQQIAIAPAIEHAEKYGDRPFRRVVAQHAMRRGDALRLEHRVADDPGGKDLVLALSRDGAECCRHFVAGDKGRRRADGQHGIGTAVGEHGRQRGRPSVRAHAGRQRERIAQVRTRLQAFLEVPERGGRKVAQAAAGAQQRLGGNPPGAVAVAENRQAVAALRAHARHRFDRFEQRAERIDAHPAGPPQRCLKNVLGAQRSVGRVDCRQPPTMNGDERLVAPGVAPGGADRCRLAEDGDFSRLDRYRRGRGIESAAGNDASAAAWPEQSHQRRLRRFENSLACRRDLAAAHLVPHPRSDDHAARAARTELPDDARHQVERGTKDRQVGCRRDFAEPNVATDGKQRAPVRADDISGPAKAPPGRFASTTSAYRLASSGSATTATDCGRKRNSTLRTVMMA
nr:hypothetical protein [Accumulibacter sp.]